MNISLVCPSVPSFPQSSILLKEREGRDSTPTETAQGAFHNAAAQPQRRPGHTHNMRRNKISNGFGRVDGTGLGFYK